MLINSCCKHSKNTNKLQPCGIVREDSTKWHNSRTSEVLNNIGRDHSFPQNAEFWAEPQNLPISAEFLCFHGIRDWTVIRGQIRYILMELRPPYSMHTWFQHEIHDCHSYFDARNTKNIKLTLSEILPVNLVERLYLSLAVTGDKCCIFGRVQRP